MATLLLKVEWGGHHVFPTKEDDGPPPYGEPLKVQWGGHHAFPTKEDDGPPPHGEEDLHFLQSAKKRKYIKTIWNNKKSGNFHHLLSQPARPPASQLATQPAGYPARQPASQLATQPAGYPDRQPTSQLATQPVSPPVSRLPSPPAHQPARQSPQPAGQPLPWYNYYNNNYHH